MGAPKNTMQRTVEKSSGNRSGCFPATAKFQKRRGAPLSARCGRPTRIGMVARARGLGLGGVLSGSFPRRRAWAADRAVAPGVAGPASAQAVGLCDPRPGTSFSRAGRENRRSAFAPACIDRPGRRHASARRARAPGTAVPVGPRHRSVPPAAAPRSFRFPSAASEAPGRPRLPRLAARPPGTRRPPEPRIRGPCAALAPGLSAPRIGYRVCDRRPHWAGRSSRTPSENRNSSAARGRWAFPRAPRPL